MTRRRSTHLPSDPHYRRGMATAMRDRTLSGAVGIGIAVGVYGVSFGVLAVAAGLSWVQACVMSMLVFTGASQFAFVGVLAAGGGALAAMGPAVMLAVRNAAYGLSLASILPARLRGGRSARAPGRPQRAGRSPSERTKPRRAR